MIGYPYPLRDDTAMTNNKGLAVSMESGNVFMDIKKKKRGSEK